MLYFDSSVLVCLHSAEARSEDLQQWFGELDPADLACSEWNITEFHSAMSFKRRTGQLSLEQRNRATELFESHLQLYFTVFPVTSTAFHRAAAIAGREDINIRAADALHLAIAEAHAATVCTLDVKMQRAAQALGMAHLVP